MPNVAKYHFLTKFHHTSATFEWGGVVWVKGGLRCWSGGEPKACVLPLSLVWFDIIICLC
jgi:hypothetical protein